MDPGLGVELAPLLQRSLRRAVRELALAERRPSFPARVHVGLPGGASIVHAVDGAAEDHALRTDLVGAMVARLRGVPRPMVWVTRAGDLDVLQDAELQWLAAAWQAFAELGMPLVFVTVNRHGWRDPRSGVGRTWARVRRRQPASGRS